MTFDVSSHPLLSVSALALLEADSAAFDAQTDAAELVLGISAADLGIESAAALEPSIREKGKLAVVKQMARDLANPPDQNGLSMERRGQRQVAYFAGRYDPDRAVDAQAKLLADAVRLAVLGDGTAPVEDEQKPWAIVRRLR